MTCFIQQRAILLQVIYNSVRENRQQHGRDCETCQLSDVYHMEAETICVEAWLSENKKDFAPPVCNKCMFAKQLKVFYVGGPNSRRDYHLEEGEEFFYQKQGDMVLKVIEHGQPRDIIIKEGEIFLLPSRVEHSPQRFENTIGFVVERTRENTEFDCVRYFVEPSTERLFERWFHLQDVVRDLPPLIKAFHASEEFKTGAPGKKSFLVNAPYEPIPLNLVEPINLKQFIESNKDRLGVAPVQIYGAPNYSTQVLLYGEGRHLIEANDYELLIWIMNDSEAVLEQPKGIRTMHSLSMTICPPQINCCVDVRKGQAITIQMMPKL
ncbi:unnamed protein product [Cylicocyclus nassatus]|uniref:3-hydroxyanthranilate 3,4-dioxygenase n=1 Tax=Cylicocyclus nassatus TaxID=53992 RepID=A0AA36GDZ9_CYLNA|nr:unnamed protein product [Cylicocyclus nassatus]